MLTPKEHFHGSDLEKIEKSYHIKKENIVSFSANVNPLGLSPILRETLCSHIDTITSYPDREYTNLRKAIGSYVKTDYNKIIVGNGSTELISLFIQFTAPKKALLLGPTYSEYEREIELAGGTCCYHMLQESENFQLIASRLEEQLQSDIDLLIICNPNNPTSTALSCTKMREILKICKKYGIFVIVDETYVEFAPNYDAISSIPCTNDFDNLVILRGVSKFFASPGLRLGYAICGNASMIHSMNEKKNPWTINSLAAVAGEIMFKDSEYICKTKDLIDKERKRICEVLSSFRYVKYYEPISNFILVKILKTELTSFDVFELCIQNGFMIRDCSSFECLGNSYFRFCLMLPEQNNALLTTLATVLK